MPLDGSAETSASASPDLEFSGLAEAIAKRCFRSIKDQSPALAVHREHAVLPQVGFSAAKRKIKARISLLTRFPPPRCPVLRVISNTAESQLPTSNRSRCDRDERLFPSSPEPQHYPEQLVQRGESMARSFGVQSQQLLGGGPDFRG